MKNHSLHGQLQILKCTINAAIQQHRYLTNLF